MHLLSLDSDHVALYSRFGKALVCPIADLDLRVGIQGRDADPSAQGSGFGAIPFDRMWEQVP